MTRLRSSLAALAVIAAFAFASQSKGDQNLDKYVPGSQQQFEITDPEHENTGFTGPRSEIEPLCPESGQVCAQEVGGSEVIEWEGPASKF